MSVPDAIGRAPASCPTCGRALPPDAIEGLCAACLLVAGSETFTASSIDEMPTVSSASGIATAPSSRPHLGEGQAWGAYRIGRLLGRGGMGEVYEAEHLDSGRRVALKVLRSRLQTAEERARFLREGQLAASVSHPHTVYIYGSEEITGTPVISMELLPGGTLKDRVVAEGPLPPAQAVAAVLDIIGGLDAAHAAGILHRDIKPSNCFVDRDGTVKVGDFGLSVSTLARDVHHQLGTSGFEGTPQFAPPEQLRGEPLDVRADIYAVGATLYYLLTGRPPFDAPDLRELFARVTSETAPSPHELRAGIPKDLAAVVMRCLAKASADRPASYAALAEALRPFLPHAAVPARPGLRLVAGIADAAILALPSTAWSLWAVDPLTQAAGRNIIVALWASVGTLIYYVVLEGLWGASLGKRLLGLRVATASGDAAPFFRAALRATVHSVVPNLPIAFLFLSGLVTMSTLDTLRAPIGLTMAGVMFLTIRRRNGWAAVHDLLTGTRVVQRTSFHAARVIDAAALRLEHAPHAAGAKRQYGPFVAVADADAAGSERLVIGFDPVLRRQVWIHVVPAGTPPITSSRRDVSRVGRLHWLTGRRSANENWDAYEAPGGRALSLSSGEGVVWAEAKVWLLDLADELREAVRDRSLPSLHVDRLWLRGDGRVVLLDFPAPGAESRAAAPDAPPALAPVAFLATVGTLLVNTLETIKGPAAVPLSARTMVARWASAAPPDLDAARDALASVAVGLDDVRRMRRGLPVALTATPVLVIVVAAALMLPYLYRFMRNPQTVEIMAGLSTLQNPNPRAARLRDPEVRAAIERYLAGRYGTLMADEAFWGTLIMSRLATLRPVARDIVSRHPAVSAEELTRAMSVIAPERERWERQSNVQVRGVLAIGGIIVTALTGLVLVIIVGFSLLSAALVPGGLLTRALGYAVVTHQGGEIGRGRSLLRAGVAWTPAIVWLIYLALSPKVQGFVPSPPLPWVGWALTVVLLTAGAAWTLASVVRGPHDRVMGTWVVAR